MPAQPTVATTVTKPKTPTTARIAEYDNRFASKGRAKRNATKAPGITIAPIQPAPTASNIRSNPWSGSVYQLGLASNAWKSAAVASGPLGAGNKLSSRAITIGATNSEPVLISRLDDPKRRTPPINSNDSPNRWNPYQRETVASENRLPPKTSSFEASPIKGARAAMFPSTTAV